MRCSSRWSKSIYIAYLLIIIEAISKLALLDFQFSMLEIVIIDVKSLTATRIWSTFLSKSDFRPVSYIPVSDLTLVSNEKRKIENPIWFVRPIYLESNNLGMPRRWPARLCPYWFLNKNNTRRYSLSHGRRG